MTGLKESVRLSIEACIREHLDQDLDRESAIVMASHEIVDVLFRPIQPTYAEQMEAAYQEHIAGEGSGQANDHPDGCWYCGSPNHHTIDCGEKRGRA